MVLRDISLDSSGVYACEASSEAPRFKTVSTQQFEYFWTFYVLSDLWIYGIYVDISGLQVSGQKEMSVVDLPDSKPLITGANPRGYKVRKQSNIVCRYILQ